MLCICFCTFFFFNDTATTEIYTLSLHYSLPIFNSPAPAFRQAVEWQLLSTPAMGRDPESATARRGLRRARSEEHTPELQSRQYLVCRLMLEKKNKYYPAMRTPQKPTSFQVHPRI